MNDRFIVYRISGYSKRFCTAVCECNNEATAHDICDRLKKSESKMKDIKFAVNPPLCPICQEKGQNVLVHEKTEFCSDHKKL